MKKTMIFITSVCIATAMLMAQDATTKVADEAAASKSSTTADAKYKIAMKYEPGKKYEVAIAMTTEFYSQSGESGSKTDVAIKYYLDVAQPAADGTNTVKLIVNRITMESGSDKFDSDKPGDRDMKELIAMTLFQYTAHFDKDGALQKIDGVEKLYDKLHEDSGVSSARAEEIEQMTKPLRQLLMTPCALATGNFTSVGDVWNGEYPQYATLTADGAGESTMALKLSQIADSQNGKVAVIDLDAKIKTDDLQSQVTGKINFNLDRKMVESVSTKLLRDSQKYKATDRCDMTVKYVDKLPALKTDPDAQSQPADAAPSSANPNAKYKIAMKYQAGQKYEITMTCDKEQTYSFEKSSTNAQGKLIGKFYVDIQSPDSSGSSPATITLGRYAAKSSLNGQEESTDSDDPSFGTGEAEKSAREMFSKKYSGTFGKDGKIGDCKSDGKADETLQKIINAPLSYAVGDFSDVGQTWVGVNENPFMTFMEISTIMDPDAKSKPPSEKLSLTLKEIVDSPAGKIAVIDMQGTLTNAGRKNKRTGTIRFNLEKQIVETMTIKTILKDSSSEKYITTEEISVKPIDSIPLHRLQQASSQPTSAPVASQPATQPKIND